MLQVIQGYTKIEKLCQKNNNICEILDLVITFISSTRVRDPLRVLPVETVLSIRYSNPHHYIHIIQLHDIHVIIDAMQVSLVTHQRSHSDCRPYVCQDCGKAFRGSSGLR